MKHSLKRSLIARAPIFLGVAAILACGTDAAAPTASMAGTYSATQFRTTGSSGQTDQLGAGSTLSLILNANHTLSGHMHLAATSASPLFDDFRHRARWEFVATRRYHDLFGDADRDHSQSDQHGLAARAAEDGEGAKPCS